MTFPQRLVHAADRRGTWAMLGGLEFVSTRVKSNGTVHLRYLGAGFSGHPAFTFDEQTQVWSADVPATECDRVTTVAPRATYRGQPCEVLESSASGVVLMLIGDRSRALGLGFDMQDRDVLTKSVEFADLDAYYEVHKDELFRPWQQANFGYSLTPGNWEQHSPDPVLPEIGYPRFRLGRFAVVNGVERPAAQVTGPVEQLYEVSVLADYHGWECQVSTIWPGGMATLRKGGDQERLLGLGFVQVEPGRFEKQAHVGAIYDYREIHHDLLFDGWLREQQAARPS